MGGVARISLQRECGCPTSACRRQMWDFDRPLLFLPARKCEGAWLQPCRKNPKIRRALAPEYHPAFKFPSFPSRPLHPPPGGVAQISLQRECGAPHLPVVGRRGIFRPARPPTSGTGTLRGMASAMPKKPRRQALPCCRQAVPGVLVALQRDGGFQPAGTPTSGTEM